MDRIDTRTQLINFICQHESSSVKRACHAGGTVKVLGGFSQVPPGTGPGWIVRITSVHGRTWFIAVSPHESRPTFNVRRLCLTGGIPWRFYVGQSPAKRAAGGNVYSIYNGDDPDKAWLFKEIANAPQTE